MDTPTLPFSKIFHGLVFGLPKFFEYPLLSQERGIATNFKFGMRIHRVHANKSPLKIGEKRERGRIQRLPKFLEYPLSSRLFESTGLRANQKPSLRKPRPRPH